MARVSSGGRAVWGPPCFLAVALTGACAQAREALAPSADASPGPPPPPPPYENLHEVDVTAPRAAADPQPTREAGAREDLSG